MLTRLSTRALSLAALRKMDGGAAGGGATVRFEDYVPMYARLLLWWMNLFMRFLGMTGGAFHVLHSFGF